LLRELFKVEPPAKKNTHQDDSEQMDEDTPSGNDQSN
jgi:hypothetical protein